jgi:hypothetical protein
MFRNTEYYSGEALDINIGKDILPYKKFFEDFDTYKFELGPSFTPSNCKTFEEMCDRYLNEIKDKESNYDIVNNYIIKKKVHRYALFCVSVQIYFREYCRETAWFWGFWVR